LAINRTEYRILPNDINKNKTIGLKLPFGNGKSLFSLTQTTESQLYYNLVNLLLTNIGERYHHPTFGTDLRDVLFENYTENVADRVKNSISKAINFWLPGIKIINIVVSDSNSLNKSDVLKNGIYVELSFIIDTNANNFRTITLFANQSGKINIVGNT
jgi:phage baseplate assembly protein W